MSNHINTVKGWIYQNMNNLSFENFSYFCGNYHTKKINTFQDLKSHNTKLIGDVFEAFCKLYLIHILKYQNVWFYNEIPIELKQQLKLTKRDMGIDILAVNDDEICAIQCKYRKRNKKFTVINWKDLSTFYALTSRTGPYDKIIVMTNADSIKRIGNKPDSEVLLNFNKFNKLSFNEWFNMCQGFNPQNINQYNYDAFGQGKQLLSNESMDNNIPKLGTDEHKEYLRQKRLKYLESLTNK